MEQTTTGNGGLSISWLLQIKTGCCERYKKHKVDFTLKQVIERSKIVLNMKEVEPDEIVAHSNLKIYFCVNKSFIN